MRDASKMTQRLTRSSNNESGSSIVEGDSTPLEPATAARVLLLLGFVVVLFFLVSLLSSSLPSLFVVSLSPFLISSGISSFFLELGDDRGGGVVGNWFRTLVVTAARKGYILLVVN